MTVVSRTENSKLADENPGGPFRIMLVDDSAVIRGMLHRWITADPDCEIVGSYHNGVQAVQHVKTCRAEIVILDIEMPEMDGLTALPQIIRQAPGIQVLMASTLTRRNADISMRALSMGAVDYLPKPESARSGTATADFQRELLLKIKAIGAAMRKGKGALTQTPRHPSPGALAGPQRTSIKVIGASKEILLRPRSKSRPDILAIGSSTGGPQALFALLGGLKKSIHVPVVITQHMPPTFTAILAEHIQNSTGLPAREAATGDLLRNGEVLVAPGNYHMTVVRKGADKVIQLDQTPQINYCRPAVDPLFKSVSAAYGSGALGVILTGMGHDGRDGARQMVEAGGTIVAQDEKSSVVWGMPGAVAEAGLCSAVIPLPEMASWIVRYTQGTGA